MATTTAAPEAARETSRAAAVSVVSNTVLTTTKLAAGFLTGSVSVLAEGIHSANDLVASFLAWFAVRKANEPPDAGHGYGHGKFESLSAFIEAAMIMVAAVAVAYTAVHRLLEGLRGDLQHGPALLVMGFSAVVNVFVSGYLFRVSRKHHSLALEADGWHLRADVWTSAGVFAGLLLIYLTDWHILDPLAAVAVAVLILFQGSRIGWTALNQLLDRSLPEEERKLLEQVLAAHNDMFVDYHRLRTRQAGRERQIDLHLVTCPHVTVAEAHAVCDHLEKDVEAQLPHTRLTIHVEPCDQSNCPNQNSPSRDAALCRLQRKGGSVAVARK